MFSLKNNLDPVWEMEIKRNHNNIVTKMISITKDKRILKTITTKISFY